jgi:hypothetical protein
LGRGNFPRNPLSLLWGLCFDSLDRHSLPWVFTRINVLIYIACTAQIWTRVSSLRTEVHLLLFLWLSSFGAGLQTLNFQCTPCVWCISKFRDHLFCYFLCVSPVNGLTFFPLSLHTFNKTMCQYTRSNTRLTADMRWARGMNLLDLVGWKKPSFFKTQPNSMEGFKETTRDRVTLLICELM